MRVDLPLAVALTVLGAGLALLATIIGMTVIIVSGHDPSSVQNLFYVVVTSVFVLLSGVISHTLGFRNGTTNGEAQAQAQALRNLMGQKGSNDGPSSH